MRNDLYPDGTVNKLLATDFVLPSTKKILLDRLEQLPVESPQYFSIVQFETLKAVCARLIPQPIRQHPVDLPGMLEKQIIDGEGNGWRYAAMPEDNQAIEMGLRAIEEIAVSTFSKSFHTLTDQQQDELLLSVQQGNAKSALFNQFSSSLFFEELLARLVELYYSHPSAKDEIGDNSFADSYGWRNTGLDEIESYQSLPLKHTND